MIFTELPLKGAFLIEWEPKFDDRGYFARTFCLNEFEMYGLVSKFVQCSTSFNHNKGLIRGMHYQEAPFEETKVIRCTNGNIFDVILDLRINSLTYKKWFGTYLSSTNGKSLYIPKGFAHGYQVMENDSEVFYMMDEFFILDAAREFSPFDPIMKGCWPLLDNAYSNKEISSSY